jgi:hypothetical protein
MGLRVSGGWVGLRERGKLIVQVLQSRFQHFAVSCVLRCFQVAQHSRSRQLDTGPLLLTTKFLGCLRRGGRFAPAIGGLDLRFDRFTFPTSSHASSVALFGVRGEDGDNVPPLPAESARHTLRADAVQDHCGTTCEFGPLHTGDLRAGG